jgi:hypothetical protein
MRSRHRPAPTRALVYAAYAMAGVLSVGLGRQVHATAVAAAPVSSGTALSDDEGAAIGAARISAAAGWY